MGLFPIRVYNPDCQQSAGDWAKAEAYKLFIQPKGDKSKLFFHQTFVHPNGTAIYEERTWENIIRSFRDGLYAQGAIKKEQENGNSKI